MEVKRFEEKECEERCDLCDRLIEKMEIVLKVPPYGYDEFTIYAHIRCIEKVVKEFEAGR